MSLRVMTYNILKGGEDRLPLILDVIRSQNPDVVALLEADRASNTDQLAQALGMQVACGNGPTRYGMAWLSRLPILQCRGHRAPAIRKSLLEIAVEFDGTPIQLFAMHLRPRISGEELRVAEVDAILDILRAAADRPHLLVGDLNTLHPDDTFVLNPTHPPRIGEWVAMAYGAPRLVVPQLLAAGYSDCYRQIHGDQPGYTFATRVPMTRIDYIFASPPMAPRLRSCASITGAPADTASDHFPVLAEFA